MGRINAIIVDDEADAVENLKEILKFFKEINVAAYETNPKKALDLVIKLKPDLLFLDVEMPILSGFDIIKNVNEKGIYPKVIFVTGYDKYAIKAIKSQAFDYILKPVDIDELKYAIEKYKDLVNHKYNLQSIYLSDLSKREKDVLFYLLQGKTSNEIAKELFISKTTVDTHRKNILLKTGMKSTRELIASLIKYDVKI